MLKVFTTINPYGNYEAQNEALLSWSKFYDVYSVNQTDEIEIAKEKFPYVNFIETDQIYNYNNKKLVKLSGILDAIKKVGSDDVAIINSDIILSNKIKYKKLNNDLIIATRWEISDSKESYPFNNGYDLFIFNYKNIDLFYNQNYVIGMPWWDFYIPVIAIKLGLNVYHIKNKLILHRTHETNYDHDSWVKFGEYLYNDIMVKLMKNPMNVDVYHFCISVKQFIGKKQINIKL